jgi:hypothetical protein
MLEAVLFCPCVDKAGIENDWLMHRIWVGLSIPYLPLKADFPAPKLCTAIFSVEERTGVVGRDSLQLTNPVKHPQLQSLALSRP